MDQNAAARPTGEGLWPLLAPHPIAHRRFAAAAGDRLARAGDPIRCVFVPIDAIVLIARHGADDRMPLTVGLTGFEGLVGWSTLLAADQWSHDAMVLAAGDLAAIAVADLDAACAADRALHRLLLRVAHNHTLQLAQSVVANLGHSAERRLARWLTMLDDRTAGNSLAVTHDQLAQLLNVRRATVTDMLHVLEGEGLVRSTRGRLQVRDRAGLQARAGRSYGLSEDDYDRTIAPFGERSADQQA